MVGKLSTLLAVSTIFTLQIYKHLHLNATNSFLLSLEELYWKDDGIIEVRATDYQVQVGTRVQIRNGLFFKSS